MSDHAVLLITDIVDSTQLAQELGDVAAADLWEVHDRIVHDVAARWRGTLINRSDGVLLQFPTVDDATEFAIAYHARIPSPLHARAGIHVGPLEVRGTGPSTEIVVGLAIPTTSRIMSLAAGGQTLLSRDAREHLAKTSRRLLSHGHWRLKGIEEPLELFEIGDGDAPFVPPPDAPKAYRVVRRDDQWLPRREVAHSLPAERNAFVGRKAYADDLARRIDGGARLVSVVGTGGTGKTRFVQHYGWRHLGDFPGGVWFCDLSQAVTFDGLCLAVAQGLGVPLGRSDPVDQVALAIAGRSDCLVVLDNFEQVAEHAPKTLGRWLDRAVEARFVVTTRVVLGIDGEEVVTLAPMGRHEGMALFTQRASAIQRGFSASPDDPLLREMVDLLDGLPLAIELAAARIRVFGLAQLVDRMRDRFKLLTSSGGRSSRQATLRATFDWSWDLLSSTEKAALAQLSVFEGGFTIESADAVLDFDDIAGIDVVDILQSLLEKSWTTELATGRFGLLKTVQAYAAEQLGDDERFPGSGLRMRMATEQRHWRHFGSLDEITATAGRCVEIDNLVAATRRATARMEAHDAVAALCCTWYALKLCGPYRLAIGLAADALGGQGLTGADRAAGQLVLGNALQYCGRVVEAAACYALALGMARECGSRLQEGRTLCAMGEQHNTASRHEDARETLERALVIARGIDDEQLECSTLNAIGNLHLNLGELPSAQSAYERALTIVERTGDRRWQGGLHGNLGGVHHAQGMIEGAMRYYAQAIDTACAVGDRRWESNARSNLGLLLTETGAFVRARAELEKAMSTARELGHLRLESIVASNLGIACSHVTDHEAAIRYFERALALSDTLSDTRTSGQTHGYFGIYRARHGAIDEGLELIRRGEQLLAGTADQHSLVALLAQRAEAEWLDGQRTQAVATLSRLQSTATNLEIAPQSALGASLTRIEALIRHQDREVTPS